MRYLKLVIFICIVFVLYYTYIVGGFSFVRNWFDSSLKLPDLAIEKLEEFKKETSFPDPLVRKTEEVSNILNAQKIFEETNKERQKEGLPLFVFNQKLALAAKNKTEDMFIKQYFDHDSPEGVTPSEVIKNAGYAYILTGENLALGGFKDEADLVTAWMNSPGHRANIMHEKFTEIGIYVREGEFEGEKVWIAVQEFGVPESSCMLPSDEAKDIIERRVQSLELIQDELESLRNSLSKAKKQSAEYGELVTSYNSLVETYQKKAGELKIETDTYNNTVRTYNTCLEKYTE